MSLSPSDGSIDPAELPSPWTYRGPTQYWRIAEDYFDIRLSQEQREILEAVATNKYVYLESANSFGKTFSLLALCGAFVARHNPSSSITTSGTYGKLKRTFCDPFEALHDNSPFFTTIDSTWKMSPNPHLDMPGFPNCQLEVASPEDAGELEGVHNEYTLAVVEEADKDAVDDEVIDSMESLVTDDRDRMIVIANPPRDEANVVNEIRADPKYTTLNYSTFDSHNVKVERGERDEPMIPGLATIDKIKDDWESYNVEAWPGFEKARYSFVEGHRHYRDDLDVRWYRRRGGVIPPATAGAHRPIYASDVREAWDRQIDDPDVTTRDTPTAVGLDYASKVDNTVIIGVHGDVLRTHYNERGFHPERQKHALFDVLDQWNTRPVITIDAIGEGSGFYGAADHRYPNVVDFKSNRDPHNPRKYENMWAEALGLLGEFLRDGGVIEDTALRKQLLAVASVVEFERKYIRSRDTDVYSATPKEEVKTRLDGESPDVADACLMAVHSHMVEDPLKSRRSPTRVFRI